MIEFKAVNKKYLDGTVALKDVNFSIDRGEFVFLTGPSGAGKTTLIKLLIREELPTSGEILLDGVDVLNLDRKELPMLRRKVGVIFQDFKLLPAKTVFENVAFPLEVSGTPPDVILETVPDVLKMVKLESRSHLFPVQLSGGERQKLAIGRALSYRPEVLIADEPTGMLDAKSCSEFYEIFQKINDLGTLVILSTHNENMIKRVGRRVVELEKGKIIKDQKGKS
ncbi:cell division ATP-binding protein FtsE [candidate division WWE3 bacterium CG_4_10_14_0_2_um_filter_42_7]|uniref:Cell division ATP-binding protein FtsE n=2 Tax=Katanobacteria TaxID=422282 RepID=A0A2H0XA15_UNCKA|nr:MAG: cell division ATP-binding protein FtsE [candidate division WWE3 bacterium CG08_land_8_20_14_0_20_41_15]PIZ43337.1 MAG: cell division ATP-binding protein FtsE [candidate division WWE3 bacterium CG_4_10_14_0_2_um_filter_42_7]